MLTYAKIKKALQQDGASAREIAMIDTRTHREEPKMKTEPKMTHTPTPWEIAHYEGGLLEGLNFIRSADGEEICSINDASEKAKANAAYIVRAVNAHEEMLLVLKELQRTIDKDHFYADRINEAIAKATGDKNA